MSETHDTSDRRCSCGELLTCPAAPAEDLTICGAQHPEHPGTTCRRDPGHSGEHATARRDVRWDNMYLSAAPAEGHTDDPATHDPRCVSVSRWHVGECYLRAAPAEGLDVERLLNEWAAMDARGSFDTFVADRIEEASHGSRVLGGTPAGVPDRMPDPAGSRRDAVAAPAEGLRHRIAAKKLPMVEPVGSKKTDAINGQRASWNAALDAAITIIEPDGGRCDFDHAFTISEQAKTIQRLAAPAEGLPTPQELIAARSVIRRLHRAVGYGKVRDVSGMEMWDSLVEGGRGIAVTTAYLGSEVDAAYGAAWEKMMDGDDHD